MALDITPGSATADSYATLTEANTYVTDRRVFAPTWWATATDPQKEQALRMAAILLDRCFDWTGNPVDGVQARAWPRSGMLTRNNFPIPTSGATSIVIDLKEAQIEFALQLGAGDRFADNDAAKQGITSVKAGSVAVTFKDTDESTAESVDMMIRRMGSEFYYVSKTVPDAVRQLLVPSWYTEHTIQRPVLFGAM